MKKIPILIGPDHLGMIEANFASLVFNAFQFLENNWERLVRDIESGMIDDGLKIDEDLKWKLSSKLRPNPARAEQLRAEFMKGSKGLARQIWPHCNLVLTCDTGSNEIYGDMLKSQQCSGLPFYSPIYAASEGLIGVNLDPLAERREYLLCPRAMFFEFIPVDEADSDKPKTLFVDQIEVGEDYELVVTNLSGLYRYRFGDVVRISSFYNTTPQIEFRYRQGQLLNVRGEKTSEKLFYEALMNSAKSWKSGEVKDYCCVESVLLSQYNLGKGVAPFYAVFVETSSPEPVGKAEENVLDKSLAELSYPYRSFRNKESIAPVRVIQVKPGTFTQFKQFMINNTEASSNQFKVPRVLRKPEAVQFMMEHKVQNS